MSSDMKQALPVLDWFRSRMERKLRVHQEKPFWRDEEGFDFAFAMQRLREETVELALAHFSYEIDVKRDKSEMLEELIDECADIANFAMMIADLMSVKHEEEVWSEASRGNEGRTTR